MDQFSVVLKKCRYHAMCVGMAIWLVVGCTGTQSPFENSRFVSVDKNQSGIHFANMLTENDSINYFEYLYIYMGGGVAIADFNQDGLSDIYFTGNMVQNKLYLNKGGLQFEDITAQAGVEGDDRWVTGVTVGDANQDGWPDLYVSVSGKWTTRKNLLYINDAKTGQVPSFTEQAEAYGVADTGNSTQAVFFDYDNDGLQDLYVANYPLTASGQTIRNYTLYHQDPPYEVSDRLYKNEGGGRFTDVTQQSGLAKYGLSLGVSVGDYNQDGWQDIYVSNDFSTPDYMLINNRDGTFSDQVREATNHTSYFGMGTDAADINNDGRLDIFQVDMLPKDNRRSKENMDSMNPERFRQLLENDMHYQYSTNTLQLNIGTDSLGVPHFSDIARMAGVSSTDWSWAALLADLDNDGFKDAFVSNGVRRDINNRDFFKSQLVKNYHDSMTLDLTQKMPSEKISNYVFKNQSDLTFANVTTRWGLDARGFSNGVAYGDLDNDGDLDLVINNLDGVSQLYENKTTEQKNTNYLRIRLIGPEKNPLGLGAKVELTHDGHSQYHEHTLTRGFQSAVDPVVHFGLGHIQQVDEVKVTWPNGKVQLIREVPGNQLLTLNYTQATEPGDHPGREYTHLVEDITAKVNLTHRHIENDFDDYRYQLLLPHKTSQYGPALAVADINGDGADDFYVGGAAGHPGQLYIQDESGRFHPSQEVLWQVFAGQEEVSAVFFDANKDSYPDLYVVCGGNEWREGDQAYRDRLYINDGKGQFRLDTSALPVLTVSGACARPADYDNDGDLDLFVGGRLKPRNYPYPVDSYILRNESTAEEVRFEEVTAQTAPELLQLGMVTAAEWTDLDNDGDLDLTVAGEWMPITMFINNGGRFTKQTGANGLSESNGWWFSLASADFDQDGDIDFVAGNLGVNYKYQASREEPFSVYTYDYDNNKKQDLVLGYYQDGVQYPVRGRECSSQQIPAIKAKFKDYKSFARASLKDIYSTEHLEKSLRYDVGSFASVFVENQGDGSFSMRPMDQLAQFSAMNSILIDDFNADGQQDVFSAGNLYGAEVETPRGDAGYGLISLGNGQGEFVSQMPYESGVMIRGEVRAVHSLSLASGAKGILIAKNNDSLQLLKIK